MGKDKMFYDEDGFMILMPNVTNTKPKKSTRGKPILHKMYNADKSRQAKVEDSIEAARKAAKGSKKPKGIKGRLKSLLKSWKKSIPSVHTKNFMFDKAENYVISFKKDNMDFDAISGFDDMADVVKSHKSWGDESFVLVYSDDHMYTKISTKAYLKLIKINRILISYHLIGTFDGNGDPTDIYSEVLYINDICDLLGFLNRHRQGIYGVYDIQSHCCEYTDYNWIFDIVVQMKNGKYKVYRNSDLNDFTKDFDLFTF